jgi:hypothetical protein
LQQAFAASCVPAENNDEVGLNGGKEQSLTKAMNCRINQRTSRKSFLITVEDKFATEQKSVENFLAAEKSKNKNTSRRDE